MSDADRVAQISARLAAVQMDTPPVSVDAAWNALETFAPSDLAWLLKERAALLRLLDAERARADAAEQEARENEGAFKVWRRHAETETARADAAEAKMAGPQALLEHTCCQFDGGPGWTCRTALRYKRDWCMHCRLSASLDAA